MNQLETYRNIIQQLSEDYAQFGSGDAAVEIQLLADIVRDHYQLMHIGWQDDWRIYGCILHLDIKDGKIWLQHNGTEDDIPAELVKLGVTQNRYCGGLPFSLQTSVHRVCGQLSQYIPLEFRQDSPRQIAVNVMVQQYPDHSKP